MSLRQLIDRLTHRLRTTGTACPCGATSWLDAWGPSIVAGAEAVAIVDAAEAVGAAHTPNDDKQPPRCALRWIVPRPTIADLRALLAETGLLDDGAAYSDRAARDAVGAVRGGARSSRHRHSGSAVCSNALTDDQIAVLDPHQPASQA